MEEEMIGAVDFQMSYNATTEAARSTSADNAGMMYRQVQALAQAGKESQMRPERVQEVASRSEVVFHAIRPQDKSEGSSRTRPSDRREESLTELRLYGPVSEKKKAIQEIGHLLDMSA